MGYSDEKRVLRLVSAAAGAASGFAAAALTLWAGRHNPSIVLVLLFAAWAASPFAGALLAHLISNRWPQFMRTALYIATLILTAASLAIYAEMAFGHPKAKLGFVFLVVPFAYWVLVAATVSIGWLRRTESR